MNNKFSAIIVAAGSGARMGTEKRKQFLEINGKEIFVLSIEKFNLIDDIEEIIVVTNKENLKEVCEKTKGYKKVKVVEGGKERHNSVYNGLMAVGSGIGFVLIHDGVRPFVRAENIKGVMAKTKETNACVLAVPVKDTIKICENGKVVNTIDRSKLWAMQTPQGFEYKKLLKAYEVLDNSILITDDAMIMENAGYTVNIVEGSYSNIKITTAEDLIFAKAIIEAERV